MDLKIIKRDGREMPFSKDKIVSAVLKAFIAVDGSVNEYSIEKANNIASYIEKEAIATNRPFSVEEIQDMVENGLMATKRKNVAREYITYRYQRDVQRTRSSKLRKMVKEKLTASNVLNQNANVDEHSFGGRMGEANSVQTRDIALNDIVSPLTRENHLNNEIYTHDLDSYVVGSHNCLSIPFDKLLWNGFNTRQADVRPAGSINTAFQLVAVIFQLQSLQQFGGVSATHLDWTMVPYVRFSFYKHLKDGFRYLDTPENYKTFCTVYENELKEKPVEDFSPYRKNFNDFFNRGLGIDLKNLSVYFEDNFKISDKVYQYAKDMTERELSQAVEGMFHNLNTLQSRSGNQLPFTSINFGTCTLPEGRMVTKAILEGCLKGTGKFHKTSIFPCVIFQCMKGVNRKKEDPNYDLFQLALKCTAQRLYPNYANVDWSGNEGYDINDVRTYFSTMGQRKLQLI